MVKKFIQRYRTLPLPARSAFWMTVCSLLQKGISILTVPVFTRLMTTTEYGQVSVFVSWSNILVLVTGLSLSAGVFNSAMIRYENERPRLLSAYLGLSTTNVIVAFLLYTAFKNQINALLGYTTLWVFMLFLILLFSPAFNLWMAKKRFEYNYVSFVAFTVLMSAFNPIIGFFCVINAEDKANARIVSMTICECIFYAALFVFIFCKGKTYYNKSMWKHAIKINVPLIPHFLSVNVLNQVDRLMINQMVSSSAAGIYSVSSSAARLLQILISAVNTSFVPWMYQKMQKKELADIRNTANITVSLMAFGTIMFTYLAPECVAVLASKEYTEAVWLFPALTASVFFMFVYDLFVNIELYYGKSIWITLASCIAAGVNVVLNVFGIWIFGYSAAAYTTLISYMLLTVLHYIFMKKILKMNDAQMPFDVKHIIYTCVIVLLACSVALILYEMIFVRYSLVIGLLVFAFFKCKSVAVFLKNIEKK